MGEGTLLLRWHFGVRGSHLLAQTMRVALGTFVGQHKNRTIVQVFAAKYSNEDSKGADTSDVSFLWREQNNLPFFLTENCWFSSCSKAEESVKTTHNLVSSKQKIKFGFLITSLKWIHVIDARSECGGAAHLWDCVRLELIWVLVQKSRKGELLSKIETKTNPKVPVNDELDQKSIWLQHPPKCIPSSMLSLSLSPLVYLLYGFCVSGRAARWPSVFLCPADTRATELLPKPLCRFAGVA